MLEHKEESKKNKQIKQELLRILEEEEIAYSLNGDQSYCVDSAMNICFKGVSSEALMISTKQYCAISNGSACTLKSYAPSYVLTAMGTPIEKIKSSVRISWGSGISKETIVRSFKEMITIAKGLAL